MAAARVAAAYPLLLGLGALDATGYSVIVPVAPAIADATGAGPATIGLLVASFPAGMVAGFAVAGWAVRRFGPRWLLIASLGVVAVGALGFVVGRLARRLLRRADADGARLGRHLDRGYVRHARTLARAGVRLHEPRVRGLLRRWPDRPGARRVRRHSRALLGLPRAAAPCNAARPVREARGAPRLRPATGRCSARGPSGSLRGDPVRVAGARRARGRAAAAPRRARYPSSDRCALRRGRRLSLRSARRLRAGARRARW